MSRQAGSRFATRREINTGAFEYGAHPAFFDYTQVATNIVVGPAPGYVGSILYLTTPPISFNPGKWRSITSIKCAVDSPSVSVFWDVTIYGNPSPVGKAAFPIGKAGDDDTRAFVYNLTVPGPGPTVLVFDLAIGKDSGVGSVIFRGASLEFEKTGEL